MIRINQFKKRPNPGQFSLHGDSLDWSMCREQFSEKFNQNTKGLFFSFHPNKFQNVKSFIEKTEQILKEISFQDLESSVFVETNLNILWIEPSQFWMRCCMKRSLFTILLRCSLFYDFNNYEQVLLYSEYSRKTQVAIKRFMCGFTEFENIDNTFQGIGKGWVDYFKNKDYDFVCGKLKLPNYLKKTNFLFGGEFIWV